MADDGSFGLPTDAFVEVLQRLPTSSRRRRFRLVCKHWRDVIDERTSERQVRTKILVFTVGRGDSCAYVFDDEAERPRHEWTYPRSGKRVVHIVGTCNGLLCLRECGFSGRLASAPSRWPTRSPARRCRSRRCRRRGRGGRSRSTACTASGTTGRRGGTSSSASRGAAGRRPPRRWCSPSAIRHGGRCRCPPPPRAGGATTPAASSASTGPRTGSAMTCG
ncbi:hypothetical protein BS78_02G092300 [Paspalum vaginatum]|nr:hypothetical protein BS78_02G092300 [Paspalum vaginatum]